MQAWNVGDANFDFGFLREWKQQGLCRYVGMTTSNQRQYDAVAKVQAGRGALPDAAMRMCMVQYWDALA